MSEETPQTPTDLAPADAPGQSTADGSASAFVFDPGREERFQELVRRYPTNFSAIMPTLWLCQEQWGWLPPGVPEWVAERLDVPVARVYELITFYTMYYLENPGRYNLQVCRNVSCHLMGAQKIVSHLRSKLGISHNQTDDDNLFRLEEVECLGACGMAPMMQVGKHYYENLTIEKVDELIEGWRQEGARSE